MSEVRLPSIANLPFVEGVYEQFLRDPSQVSEDWRAYFRVMENGAGARRASPRAEAELQARLSATGERTAQDRVDQLIRVYRLRGHIIAHIDETNFPVAQRGTAVTLQIHADDLSILRKPGQVRAEHLDLAQATMKKQQRLAHTIDGIIVAHTIDRDVAALGWLG